MSSTHNVKIAFGTSSFTDSQTEVLAALAANGVKEIDTAHMYQNGKNEIDLGEAGVGDGRFKISTKNPGGWNAGKALLPDNLYNDAHTALKRLKIKQLDIFYIHAPDRSLNLDQWVPTVQKLYEEGVFKRFGLSNFNPEEVKELHAYNKKHNYVLPTVFQGNYNPVARKYETALFPVLRDLGIAFYAYSALAGGFLTKTRQQLTEAQGTEMWNTGGRNKMYTDMYLKESYLSALDLWHKVAKEEGTSTALLAYRWVAFHSALKPERGDTLVLGGSKIAYIKNSVEGLRQQGPLKDSSVKGIEEIWRLVEKDSPLDNFHWFEGQQS